METQGWGEEDLCIERGWGNSFWKPRLQGSLHVVVVVYSVKSTVFCEVGTTSSNSIHNELETKQCSFGYWRTLHREVLSRFLRFLLRRLLSGLSPMRSGFRKPVQSVLDLWWAKRRRDPPPPHYFGFPIRTIPPILHIVCLHVALTIRPNGRSLATCKQITFLSDIGEALDKMHVSTLFRVPRVTMRGSAPPVFLTYLDVTYLT
jgi:hypothetical protein